ncbi:hypothetical protein BX661DRAFT_168762 [Kickxella alabastrina]|uniref:uncharacterized protein n=1 Tax=Kickxella alabastrina TaxID=61397 RepID=UPI00221FB39F|nr:uncharacterized protein BX661DRAFT_168762 [Kickxella alabastrina]KAI7833614.1 hypothetical protein BX661DRAFT_168762 [Kickxella alabastrina]
MGKRKSSRKVVKKERPKLDTTFDCLFCNHEKSIHAAINHLSAAIDVYSEWIDACEEAKLRELGETADGEYRDEQPRQQVNRQQQSGYADDDDAEDYYGRSGAGVYERDEHGVPGQLSDESDLEDF